MQVILLERVGRLGQMGDVVTVKDGFARNFLLPQGKALRANKDNRAKFESQRAQLEADNLTRKSEAEAISGKLEGQKFVAIRQAGDTGQLYGSVASRDVADAVTAGGFSTTADPGTSSIAPALQKVDSFPYRHRVRDVMTSPVEMAPLEMSVHAALDVMVRKRISSVLIGTPTGEIRIATERDILRAIHARGAAALAETVVSISNGPIDTVPADDFLYRAIGRIARMGYRHLGVHDSDGRLVGIVSTGNLMRHRSATALMLGFACVLVLLIAGTLAARSDASTP